MGVILEHISIAKGHLLSNRHPFLGLIGLTISPLSNILEVFLLTVIDGIALSKAIVYGWRGL